MARRKRVGSKFVSMKPDKVYDNPKIAKLTNMIMCDGKFSIAYKIVCGALDMVYEHHLKKTNVMQTTKEEKTTADKESKSLKNKDKIDANKKEEINNLFEKIIDMASPRVEVKSRRIGGANYQVPVEVRATRKLTLVLRWIIKFSRARSGKNMLSKLAYELIDTLEGKSNTLRERENIHKMAMANQAFANFKR